MACKTEIEAVKLTQNQREFRLQLAVVKHLDSCFVGQLEYFHIPNRGGDATDGYFKQMMGAKAGAPDLVIGFNGGNAFIELKAPGGTLSSQQNKFLSRWHRLGWHTAVCKSVREVHDALVGWGLKPLYNSVQEPNYASDEEKKQASYNFFAPQKPLLNTP